MEKLLKLRQQKAELVKKSKDILTKADTENRSITAEEGKELDTLKADIEGVNQHIQQAEFLANEERALIGDSQNVETPEAPSNSELRAWIQSGDTRSLSAGTAADGGYTVIPFVDKEIYKILKELSVFRQHATTKTIATETYKKLVSVGGTSLTWAAESDARSETNTSTLEEVALSLNSLYAYPTTTQELLDWSDFDVAGWLSSEVAAESVLKEEAAFWNGDAVKKPKGLLTYTRAATVDGVRAFGEIQEVTSVASSVIDFDDLIKLVHTLAVPYRANAKFYMNDTLAEILRKLKNSQDEYIWRDSVVEGQPTTLLGKPVVFSEQLANDEIVYGDLSRAYYVIDHSSGVRMIRDNITAPGFVKMLTTRYVGGGLMDDRAVKILKAAA